MVSMIMAILLSFINWKLDHSTVSIKPDLISCIMAFAIYSAYVLRIKGLQRMTSYIDLVFMVLLILLFSSFIQASVYKGYKRDKIEMRGDRAEMSDFPLYLNTVAGGLDCRNQAIGGFSFVIKIYALPVVEIIGQFLYLLGRYGFDAQIGYCF